MQLDLALLLSFLAFCQLVLARPLSPKRIATQASGAAPWSPFQDVPFGQFGPAFRQAGSGTPGSDNITEDASGLAPALAPGVQNSLGIGFDPQFLTVTRNGKALLRGHRRRFWYQRLLESQLRPQ